MKRIILIVTIYIISFNFVYAGIIKPNKNLSAYDVIKIQLEALKNNDENDNGIKQTWVFAHPKNKEITGPYPRFRIMIYDVHYSLLLNHYSHNINLIMNSQKKYVFGVKILDKRKKQFFYEWHVEKGNENNCNSCWFTTVVSMPTSQGSSI